MKTTLFPVLILVVCLNAPARADAPITQHLQQGLLEEEVNRDLEAAIRAYEAAVTRFDDQRNAAATAVFRLAECHRKLGRTDPAITLYRRVLTEFGDQTTLADLSRTHLARLGAQPEAVPAILNAFDPDASPIPPDDAMEIARLRQLMENSPDLLTSYRGGPAVRVAGRFLNLSPFLNAVSEGRLAVVRFLLDGGLDPNEPGPYELTPLHLAASNGHKTVVELLLERGADVNAQALWGRTPLHLAVANGHRILLQTLLDAKPDLDVAARGGEMDGSVNFGETALSLAVRRNSLPMARALLEAGADPNATSPGVQTAIHWAVVHHNRQLIELLLDHGADVNAADADGETPLNIAIEANWVDGIERLRERGAVPGRAH